MEAFDLFSGLAARSKVSPNPSTDSSLYNLVALVGPKRRWKGSGFGGS